MFTFKKFEECRQAGLPKDAVDKSQRNVFHYSVNVDGLNDLLFVRFLPDMVQFFCENDENEVSETGRGRMLASISLRNAKETGNDLLYFADSDRLDWEIKDSQIERIKADKDSLIACLKTLCDIYSQFPFASELKKNILKGDPTFDDISDEKKFKHVKSAFLKFCLLEFVSTVETEDEIFTLYPGFEAMRGKLRQSKVYQLLCSKVKYDMLLYKDMESQCNEQVISDSEFNYVAKRFADLLMDKDLNKIIPPDYYDGEGWFDNPEEELERVLEKIRGFKQKTSLYESIVSKIRSFLYTKHSVYRANTTEKSKKWFICAQGLMCVFNVLSICALLLFKKSCFGWYYNGLYLIGLLTLVIVIIFVIMSSIHNGKGVIDAFFPRIIVAEAAAWLTIGIAEDLVKSMLWTERVWIALIIVLILVGILIYSETKQHSLYLKWKVNVTKTLLVMNHSVFFALILGIITQSAFYDKLLRTSNVLSDVIYKEHFDKVDNYIQELESLEKSVNEYQKFAQDYCMSLNDIDGDNSGRVTLKGKAISANDTLDIILDNNRLMLQSAFSSSFKSDEDVANYHENLVNSVNSQIKRLNGIMNSIGCNYLLFCKDTLISDVSNLDSTIKLNYEKIYKVLPDIHKEMQVAKSHCLDDDYNTLLEWATVDKEIPKSTSNYLNMLIRNDKIEKCCRNVGWGKPKNGHRFYPTLLLMHTLLVLVIAFITQLIISDKSVTEPL